MSYNEAIQEILREALELSGKPYVPKGNGPDLGIAIPKHKEASTMSNNIEIPSAEEILQKFLPAARQEFLSACVDAINSASYEQLSSGIRVSMPIEASLTQEVAKQLRAKGWTSFPDSNNNTFVIRINKWTAP